MIIWIVSHYTCPPDMESCTKTVKYAEELTKRGHNVTLITASTVHNTDINLVPSDKLYINKKYGELNFIHIKCSNYRGSGIKRIINLKQFQHRFKKVMKNFEKPDVIVGMCNCINYKGICEYAKKNNVPYVNETRDLWPLSIVEYKNISDRNPIIRYLYGQERKMYEFADALIFSMEGGWDYIKDKKWDKSINPQKVFNINNGLDIKLQNEQREKFTIDDCDLSDDKFKVVYAGSIRMVNSVDLLVKAAERLMSYPIEFLIYGDGDDRAELEKYCKNNGVTNVKFKGEVKKKYIPYICAQANINFISVKETGVSKYGVSWNKLFDYMNAGKPILSTVSVNYDLLRRYDCGISLSDQSPESIAEAVLYFYNMPKEEYDRMSVNAKNAVKDFDYSVLTDKLEKVIKYAIEHRRGGN